PDGERIAFNCQGGICLVNRDGNGLVRLTNSGFDPTWSPDGTSIVFSTYRFGYDPDNPKPRLAIMNPDGTSMRQIGSGVAGFGPTWSPDGSLIAFWRDSGLLYAIYTMKPDGTDVTFVGGSGSAAEIGGDWQRIEGLGGGMEPAWMPARVPVATFTVACNGLTCSFDGSGSSDRYGTISDYAWSFGD